MKSPCNSSRSDPLVVHPETVETRDQLRWFVRLRWLAIAGVALSVPAAQLILGLGLELVPVGGIVLLLSVYNLAFALWLKRQQDKEDSGGLRSVTVGQILLDLVTLTLLVHFTGGIENPFSLYFVFHVVIGAILFPGRESLLITTFAFMLYGSMATLEGLRLIPLHPLTGLHRTGFQPSTAYYILGQFALGSTLFIVRYFAAAVSRRLSQRTRELTVANELLRRADRDRLQAVAMVTHELRSPMAAVDSLLETITGGYVKNTCRDCEVTPILERARLRIKGLLKLTGDVLDLHQLELGECQLERSPLQLDPVLAEVVEEFAEMAGQAGVTIEQSGVADLPDVMADRQSVRFITSNLVANAVRYNRAGGTVSILGRATEDTVELIVSDSGVGIPSADLPRVFDIFYRGSYARQTERLATGLGLSLVKRLVEAQGGSVWVKSRDGQGSEFGFTLPLASKTDNVVRQ